MSLFRGVGRFRHKSLLPSIVSTSFNAGSGAATGSISITKPTGVSVGNLLVAVLYADSYAVSFSSTGWTSQQQPNDGSGAACAILTRTADGTEASSISFTCSTGQAQAGGIINLSNARFAGAGVGATAGSLQSVVSPSLTTPTANCLLFDVVSSVTSGQSWTAPSGMTQQWAGSSAPSGAVYSQSIATAGSTGTRTAANTSSATKNGSMFMVAPASWVFPTLSVVGSVAATQATAGSITFSGAPSGTQNGDLLVALFIGNASTFQAKTGWNHHADQGAIPGLEVYSRTASSESGSYVFTASSGSGAMGGILVALRSTSGTPAVDATGSVVANSNSPTVTATAVANYCRGLSFFGMSAASNTIAAPSGSTSVASDNDATSPSWQCALTNAYVLAGGTLSGSTSISGGALGSGSVMLSIKPA
jgi:hypothetical protein